MLTGKRISTREVQPLKVEPLMYFVPEPKLTRARLAQFWKAVPCSSSTPSGITISVSALQSAKAEVLIVFTEPGSVSSVRLLQPLKAELPMLVTPSGMLTLVRALQFRNA